jgi:hypothetical protein
VAPIAESQTSIYFSCIRYRVGTFRIFDEWSWPSVTVILTTRADKDVSNPRRGRKFKVAWRPANARTAVSYFKITKKAAKQTIPLSYRLGIVDVPSRSERTEIVRGEWEEMSTGWRKDLIYRSWRADAARKCPSSLSHRRRIYRNELILPESWCCE